MASAVLVRTVVFDEHLYHGNGSVIKWTRKISSRFAREARHYAPVDTGELVAGIRSSTRSAGPKMCQGLIGSTAPHTMWVLRGTGFPVKGHEGNIYTTKGFRTQNKDDAYVTLWGVQPRGGKFSRKGKGDKSGPGRRMQHRVRKKGYWLKLPFPSRYGGFIRTFSVRGQEPNNFMEKAWRATQADHTAIRGVPFPLDI